MMMPFIDVNGHANEPAVHHDNVVNRYNKYPNRDIPALYHAIKNNHLRIVRALIDAKADARRIDF